MALDYRIFNLIKGILTANLALVVRAARYGVGDARRRSKEAYAAIEPLEPKNPRPGPVPVVPLEDLVKPGRLIAIPCLDSYVEGTLPTCDRTAILGVLVDRNPSIVLEVGTFNGSTTRLIARNLPDATIHTIDLPPGYDPNRPEAEEESRLRMDDFHLIQSRKVGSDYLDDPMIRNVIQHFGDSAKYDFRKFQGATFCFIDGSHTYDYARSDTLKCLEILGDGPGTLLWHDCDEFHEGVLRWIVEMKGLGHPVKIIKDTHVAIMDL